MYIRKLKNRSGSTSIQIIRKDKGRYIVIKSLGSATTLQEIENLKNIARKEIKRITRQKELFISEKDKMIQEAFVSLQNANIRTIGPELIFGKIYDYIGFNTIEDELFRHLVIARIAFPLSKLKTTEYIYRYQGIKIGISSIYRFLDKLHDKWKDAVEQIAFNYTKKIMGGKIGVVFYDMTTLYFEASDEDDLRKTGFSKDGKHQSPQIFLGLLIAQGGYVIGYDIYEGNTFEGDTLMPFIEKISDKFNLNKPIVIADAGLLSNKNLEALEFQGYEYIVGARIKNESKAIKEQILDQSYIEGSAVSIEKTETRRLIVNYSSKRASKDEYNRERGLRRLEKRIKSGKLTKSNINNRGYNKFLKMEGEIKIAIDYSKKEESQRWDGLKGYITNTSLSNEDIITNYKELWHIEKAFRMSKTDLRIRPIYHRLRNRIEAHICISFAAYSIYKELERILYQEKSTLSLRKAAEATHNMYQVIYQLPDSKETKSQLLGMDEQQKELYSIVMKYF